jgi:hypothetical protein
MPTVVDQTINDQPFTINGAACTGRKAPKPPKEGVFVQKWAADATGGVFCMQKGAADKSGEVFCTPKSDPDMAGKGFGRPEMVADRAGGGAADAE